MKPVLTLCVSICVAAALAGPARAGSASLTFSPPTNDVPKTITVQITLPGGNPQSVIAMINPGTPVQVKRSMVVQALTQAGFQAVPDVNPAKCVINNLAEGAQVALLDQGTGEIQDTVSTTATNTGTISFTGFFDPNNYLHQPAIFTAGIVTDLGELRDQVSASELNFQTDGPIICQALFQRLAPRAPQYGAQINYAGDRLEVYFDPAYTVTQGGVIFGTNSTTPGDSGAVVIPQPAFPTIPPGNDYWSIDQPPVLQFGGSDVPPIPADFFYPGSQPFFGPVLFGGKAIDPIAGSADTIVHRMTSCDLPDIGSTATVPIEMVALNLQSVDPITIGGFDWKVKLTVPAPQPTGSMTITRGSADGGTFNSTLPVRPIFIFTPVSGGTDRTWDPGVTIHFDDSNNDGWYRLPVAFAQAGGGPEFYPSTTAHFICAGSAMTQEPALNNGITVGCPPLDANRDNVINGDDLQLLVDAYLLGPAHPSFCALDLNSNGIADAEDISLAVTALLTWQQTTINALTGWVNVKDVSCDFKHHPLTTCTDRTPPRPERRRSIAVRAADKDGNPSGCPVKFRLYNCDGIGMGAATEVEQGDNECVEVPENRELQVWCKSTGDACRISMKELRSCP